MRRPAQRVNRIDRWIRSGARAPGGTGGWWPETTGPTDAPALTLLLLLYSLVVPWGFGASNEEPLTSVFSLMTLRATRSRPEDRALFGLEWK
jgi:hypothetical protein